MNYFIIIVNDQKETNSLAPDIYTDLMSQSIWGFGPNTQNLKKISKGDKLVYYLAGSKGQKFVGTAEVDSATCCTSCSISIVNSSFSVSLTTS